MSTSLLLTVSALVEGAAGVALLVLPATVAELLLGEGLGSPQAFVVARVAGAALLTLSVPCWVLRREAAPRVRSGLIGGLLIYNVAVPVLLVHAALASALHGVALWPAAVGHTGLALWCAACLVTR
jgi:hypothetical protein